MRTRAVTPGTAHTAFQGRGADSAGIDIGLLVLRLGAGGLLFVSGSGKLFGWFHGAGWARTAGGFEKMGYHPGKLYGTLAGLCEFTGGTLLILGLLTPLAAAIVIGTMINAVHVTWPHGLIASSSGILLIVAAAALGFAGPGRISLDHGRLWQRQGIGWGLGAIVLGTAAALITLAVK
jgi:putative oxidoreductase